MGEKLADCEAGKLGKSGSRGWARFSATRWL